MITLRPYQQSALDNLFTHIEKHGTSNHPLVMAATGAGKSIIIAKFCEQATQLWDCRIIMLTHVKELVEQNYKKMRLLLPPQQVGVYCAGLKRKQPNHPIVCASIQSAHRAISRLGDRHIIIIDEVHLMKSGDEGMYRNFIKQYPNVIIIGLTATPFRTDSGTLVGPNKLFQTMVAEITTLDLLKQKYLAPLIAIDSELHYDTSKIRITAGEFNAKDLNAMALDIEKTRKVVAEIIAYGKDRKKWLIFCSSIKHAEFISQCLQENGISCATVHQKINSDTRERILKSYKNGTLQAITNVGVLTTGFDAPETDMLVLLRPTQSPVLYVQMLGRGMRIAEGKSDCLVLDYGENVARHGPVTHVRAPQKKGRIKVNREFGDEENEPKVIVCQECRAINEPEAEKCYMCEAEIIKEYRKVTHTDKASREQLIAWEEGETYKTLKVDRMRASVHKKEGKPDSIKVSFECGFDIMNMWLCLWHGGYAQRKGRTLWFNLTHYDVAPLDTKEAIEILEENSRWYLKDSNEDLFITIKNTGKYPEVMEIKYESKGTRKNTGSTGNPVALHQHTEAGQVM